MSLRTASLCLFLSVPVVAQTPTQPEVTKNLICDRGSTCGFGYINGRKYETLASDKIGIVIVGDAVGKYLRADILVLNESAKSVDVLPSNFVLVETSPKQKPLKYVDGDKAIRSAERRLAWGNALTAMGGNMARQQTTTTTNSNGTNSPEDEGTPLSPTSAEILGKLVRKDSSGDGSRQKNEAHRKIKRPQPVVADAYRFVIEPLCYLHLLTATSRRW